MLPVEQLSVQQLLRQAVEIVHLEVGALGINQEQVGIDHILKYGKYVCWHHPLLVDLHFMIRFKDTLTQHKMS